MQVIICGTGQVGSNIARTLAAEGNDVTVIDYRADLIRRIGEALDVKAMTGYASHPEVLEAAGAKDADMLIAVTYSDEVNMVACQVAHSLFEVPMKIARVRAQSYLDPTWATLFSRDHMPIDLIISPEIEVARAITRRLQVPGATDMIPFADGKVRLIAVKCETDCPVVDTPLRELTELFPELNILVVGILRGDELFVPRGEHEMHVGDEVFFIADSAHVTRAMAAFGHEEREARRMLIVGGGNIGLFLARELQRTQSGLNLKVIEVDKERAAFLADQLADTMIINGDALDREILEEANVAAAEAVIAVTNGDEINILSSLLAKRAGCRRAITLVNNSSYRALVSSLGVDVVVSPRETTVSSILRRIRRGRIEALHSFRDGAAEVVEAIAMETSPLVGKPVREVELPEGTIIGAVVRGQEVIIPRGDTVMRPNDRVVIFAAGSAIKKLERMFAVKLEYF